MLAAFVSTPVGLAVHAVPSTRSAVTAARLPALSMVATDETFTSEGAKTQVGAHRSQLSHSPCLGLSLSLSSRHSPSLRPIPSPSLSLALAQACPTLPPQVGNNAFLNEDLMGRAINGPGVVSKSKLKIAVVGAGLAGMIAAMDLVDAGHDVELFELRPFVGGKVSLTLTLTLTPP